MWSRLPTKINTKIMEVVHLLHRLFPQPESERVSFLDVNPTMRRLLNLKVDDAMPPMDRMQSPWSPSPKTLVGSSVVVMRIRHREKTMTT